MDGDNLLILVVEENDVGGKFSVIFKKKKNGILVLEENDYNMVIKIIFKIAVKYINIFLLVNYTRLYFS